jgi:hypothetical protein
MTPAYAYDADPQVAGIVITNGGDSKNLRNFDIVP